MDSLDDPEDDDTDDDTESGKNKSHLRVIK